jgi:hypothetical protein
VILSEAAAFATGPRDGTASEERESAAIVAAATHPKRVILLAFDSLVTGAEDTTRVGYPRCLGTSQILEFGHYVQALDEAERTILGSVLAE